MHIDIWGPFKDENFTHTPYFLTIVDDYNRDTWVFLMGHKSEAGKLMRNFIIMVDRQYENKIKKVRSDNGSEFFSRECQDFFTFHGIIHEKSCARMELLRGSIETFLRYPD